MNPQLSPKAIREIREGTCNPLGAPQVTTDLSENIILTSLDDLHNWARLSSLWPLLYGTACCFIEFAALIGSRFDFDRFGLVPRSSPSKSACLGELLGTNPNLSKSNLDPIKAANSIKQQAVPYKRGHRLLSLAQL